MPVLHRRGGGCHRASGRVQFSVGLGFGCGGGKSAVTIPDFRFSRASLWRFSSAHFLRLPNWVFYRFLSIFSIELVLKKLLRIVMPFQVEELVGLRICAKKLRRSWMQPV